jgi:hypothetical protein
MLNFVGSNTVTQLLRLPKAAKPKGPTLTPVYYDPFVGPAIRAAIVTVAIGLGITGAACLAVSGFFGGLGWVIAGFARD